MFFALTSLFSLLCDPATLREILRFTIGLLPFTIGPGVSCPFVHKV
jgi:hypothetical protein